MVLIKSSSCDGIDEKPKLDFIHCLFNFKKTVHATIQIQSVITICLGYHERIVYALCCIFGNDFKTVFSNSNLFGWLMIDLLE